MTATVISKITVINVKLPLYYCNRDVTFPYDEWSALQPDFKYHGRNLYTYLLSKYGKTRIYPRGSENRQIDNVKESMMIPVEEGVAPIDHPLEMELHPLGGISKAALDLVPLPLSNSDKVDIDTFDFVTLQLYEGYSHVLYQTKILKQSQHLVLIDLIRSIYNGWVVDFTSDTAINWTSQTVSVNKSRLVLGLANGWAGDGKFLLLQPEEVTDSILLWSCSCLHLHPLNSPQLSFLCVFFPEFIVSFIPYMMVAASHIFCSRFSFRCLHCQLSFTSHLQHHPFTCSPFATDEEFFNRCLCCN